MTVSCNKCSVLAETEHEECAKGLAAVHKFFNPGHQPRVEGS